MGVERPRLRLGWWWLPIIAVGLLAVVLLFLALWLPSTADLEAEEARARSLGVVVDGIGLVAPAVTAEQRKAIRQLSRILARATACAVDDGAWLREPFGETPQGLAAWNSGIDAEFDACIRAFPDFAPAVVGLGEDPLLLPQQNQDYWECLALARDLLARRSVRGREDATALGDLLARLARLPAVVDIWPDNRSVLLAEAWVAHVLRHRAACDPSTTAVAALALADHLEAKMRLLLEARPAFLARVLRADAETYFRAANMRLPTIMTNQAGLLLLPRLGRRAVLARAVDSCAWISTHGMPGTIAAAKQASPSRPIPTWGEQPRETMSLLLDCGTCLQCAGEHVPMIQVAIRQLLRCTTGLRLLAAELTGAPWPADPGDPAGGRLRPVLRDGTLIGAYGSGHDGIDHGGDRTKDWCWPLRAGLGSPRASDPVKPP